MTSPSKHLDSDIFRQAFLALALAMACVTVAAPTASADEPPTPAAPSAPDLPATDNEVVLLPEFRVASNDSNSYLATQSTTGTRISEPLIDLPYSVNVITSQFFNDFMLFDIDSMDAFISGITPADPAGSGNGGTKLRGFGVPYYRNGFAIAQQPDSGNVDRVEVLDGPASSIYGATAPGGILNFVTKKPLTTPDYALEEFAGSYGYKRTQASATGPIDDRLSYRVDFDYTDQKRPTDFWFDRVVDVSGVLVYRFSPDTSIDFEAEYSKNIANPYTVFMTFVNPQGITAGYVDQIPNSLYPGLASRLQSFNQAGPYNRYERYDNSFYATFDHRFNEHVSMQVNATYSDRHYRRDGTTGLGSWSLITNTWTSGKLPYHETIDYQYPGAQADLAAHFVIDGVVSQTHVGFDALGSGSETKTWEMSSTTVLQSFLPPGMLAEWQKPNPFNLPLLVSLGTPLFNSGNGDWPVVAGSTSNLYYQEYGLFLNETLSFFNDRLVVMGTVRQDQEAITDQQPLSTNPRLRDAGSRNSYDTFSTGFSYKIINEKLVAYANLGTSYNPSPTVDANTGTFYGNTTARGEEGGLKGLLLNQRLSYTAEVYDVRQNNQEVANPANPGGANPLLPADAPGGSSEAKGAGIDVTGNLTDNISLIGQMTWNATRTVENLASPSTVGERVANSSPARAASIAAVYSFNGGSATGLRLGLTYTYATEILETYSSSATTVNLFRPGYGIYGGMAMYTWMLGPHLEANVHGVASDILNEKVITANGFAPTGALFTLAVGLEY